MAAAADSLVTKRNAANHVGEATGFEPGMLDQNSGCRLSENDAHGEMRRDRSVTMRSRLRVEPGGLNVERVRALHPGDACPHSANAVSVWVVPTCLSVALALRSVQLRTGPPKTCTVRSRLVSTRLRRQESPRSLATHRSSEQQQRPRRLSRRSQTASQTEPSR